MRTFQKSSKLENVCYDVRGPVLDEANRMQESGIDYLKLNILETLHHSGSHSRR